MSSDSGSGSSDSSEDIFAVEDEVKSRACAKKGTPSTRGKKQEAFSSQSVVVDVDSDWVVEDSGSDADLQQAIANSLGEKAMDGGGARLKEKRAALVGAPKLPKVTASKKGAGRKQVPPPDDEDGSTKPRTGECWMCKVSHLNLDGHWDNPKTTCQRPDPPPSVLRRPPKREVKANPECPPVKEKNAARAAAPVVMAPTPVAKPAAEAHHGPPGGGSMKPHGMLDPEAGLAGGGAAAASGNTSKSHKVAATCSVAGCSRNAWNGKRGQRCRACNISNYALSVSQPGPFSWQADFFGAGNGGTHAGPANCYDRKAGHLLGGEGGAAGQRAAADSSGGSNGARGGGRGGAGGAGGSREKRRSGGQPGSAADAMASAIGGGDFGALRWQHQLGCADSSKCHCRQQALRKIELAQKDKLLLQNQAAGAAFGQQRAFPLEARASASGTRRYSTSYSTTTASAPRNVGATRYSNRSGFSSTTNNISGFSIVVVD